MPRNWGFSPSKRSSLPAARGRKAIVAGSCSSATNAQVQHFVHDGGSAHELRAERLAADFDLTVAAALAWCGECWAAEGEEPVLVYSTAPSDKVNPAYAQLVERAMAELARAFVERGVGILVIAGGETAGVCVKALDITEMQIGPQIDPGVPWCYSHGLHLALKSGNFGSPDFFSKAFAFVA